jgi:hypothetical protein
MRVLTLFLSASLVVNGRFDRMKLLSCFFEAVILPLLRLSG